MQAEGMRIFGALFKRVWRSMKHEFEKLYMINGLYMPEFVMLGDQKIVREWFTLPASEIAPMCDPAMYSEQKKHTKAVALKQSSMTMAGYDRDEVEKNYLRAFEFTEEEIKKVFPGSKVTGPLPNPKVELEKLKMQGKTDASKQKMYEVILKIMSEQDVNKAKIHLMEAQAQQAVASAKGTEAEMHLRALEIRIDEAKHTDEMMSQMIEMMLKGTGGGDAKQGGMGGMAQGPGNQGALPNAVGAEAAGNGGMG
jgi:hypothetical protein